MDIVMNLDDNRKVFGMFEKICAIPHGSGNTKQISDFIKDFAVERGHEVIQDKLNNLIIRVKASEGYENEETLILQGHMDMVCEKTQDCGIDFLKDPIRLKSDGVYMYAEGTTLGGDDGIAIAYCMAVMDDASIPHPELEMIMTVDEEVGMDGAAFIDLSSIKGRKLINIDSEDEGVFLTSCAGGQTLTGSIPVKRTEVKGIKGIIRIDGLKGGHSGCEIDKGRANSNMLAGRVLLTLSNVEGFDIIGVSGGLKDNAIPRSTDIECVYGKEEKEKIEELLAELNKEIVNEYYSSDPDISIKLEDGEEGSFMVLDKKSRQKAEMLLNNVPCGIQAMSMEIKNLVETSLNPGILVTEEKKIVISFSLRSSIESAKNYLSARVTEFIEFLGGKTKVCGDYPGWQYKRDSKLRELFVSCYNEMYGEQPQVMAIHAGLECGILSGKIPDLDCISFGPDILDIHTVSERLDIASAARTYQLLLKVLGHKEPEKEE